MDKKMNQYRGFGAIEPLSMVGIIISKICGSMCLELKEAISSGELSKLPINENDARKIVSMHWNYLTLEQLVEWIDVNNDSKCLTEIKTEILKIILSSGSGNLIVKTEDYGEYLSRSRLDDLIVIAETLISTKSLENHFLDDIQNLVFDILGPNLKLKTI
jgi:hypothetical protein